MAMSCGISAAQIDGLSEWRNNNLFSDRQCVVLAFADGMASAAGVDDATFDAMKKYFSSQEIVELTMNAAYYTSARRSAARCAYRRSETLKAAAMGSLADGGVAVYHSHCLR